MNVTRTERVKLLTDRFNELLHTLPPDQSVDEIHRELLMLGVSEAEALGFNRKFLDRFPIPFPKFSTYEIFLTRRCNLHCSYCFVHEKDAGAVMSPSTAEEAVRFIVKTRDEKRHLSVVFMGGEPLLEFGLIRRIVTRLREDLDRTNQEYRFDITTNGVLITEEMMKFFSKNRVMLLLSVDGDRETHDLVRRDSRGGTWDRIAGILHIVRRYQPYMGTKATVIPKTAGDMLHNVKTLAGIGFKKIIMGAASGVPWGERDYRTFKEQAIAILEWLKYQREYPNLKVSLEEALEESMLCGNDNRWGCRAGRTGLVVNWDGRIFPCSKVIGVGKKESILYLGNLWQGITEIETRRRLCGYIPTTRKKCYDCPFTETCLGGCYATNYEATGDPFQPDPSGCRMEALFQEMVREIQPEKQEGAEREQEIHRKRTRSA